MNDLIEKNMQVKLNSELNSLEVSFTGFIPYEAMSKALQHEYAMIRYYKLRKCIVDLRAMGIYAPGVSDLVKNEWFPQIIKDGIKKVAFVVPENIFGEQSMKKAHQDVNEETHITVDYFQDMPSAKQWMSSFK